MGFSDEKSSREFGGIRSPLLLFLTICHHRKTPTSTSHAAHVQALRNRI